jgi:hypothetical protein
MAVAATADVALSPDINAMVARQMRIEFIVILMSLDG